MATLEEKLDDLKLTEKIKHQYDIEELDSKYAQYKRLAERVAELSGLTATEAVSVAQSIAVHYQNVDWILALDMMHSYHLTLKRMEEKKQGMK